MTHRYHTLRLILGDQLNAQHSWYRERDGGVIYVLAELKQETAYVTHHVQKLCAFFAAMADFADQLNTSGHAVLHLTLDDTCEHKDLPALIYALCAEHKVTQFQYQVPDEFRLKQQFEGIALPKNVSMQACGTEHFMLAPSAFAEHIKAGKHNRMEVFYRRMRKQHAILMKDGKPEGGKWNYDSANRKKINAAELANIPEPLLFTNDVRPFLERLDKHKVDYIGKPVNRLPWPVNREQSLQLLAYFCEHLLPCFGRFQDAMTAESEHKWSLYHSRLSFSLNSKMLHPKEVIDAALDAYQQPASKVSLPQIEGFVRQILGWREYIRAVYWVNMPGYARLNHFKADRELPGFFWHAETKMQCLHLAISQSLEHAYAHHIQRLMITGNFCLLAGVDPEQVDNWYLGIYIDAIEWVEMPNTRGMSQFADGGLIATKPYSASGNYVNKMSDYCKGCAYKVKEKVGDDACPLNSLYWHFMHRHRDSLATNPRIGMVYRNWDKQSPEVQQATLERGQWCLDNLHSL